MRESKHGAEGAVRKEVMRLWVIRVVSMLIVCGLLIYLMVSRFKPRSIMLINIAMIFSYIIALGVDAKNWFDLNVMEKNIDTYIEKFITASIIATIAIYLIFSAIYRGVGFLLNELTALVALIAIVFVIAKLQPIFVKLPPELKAAFTVVTDFVAIIMLFLGVVRLDVKYALLSFLWVVPVMLDYFPYKDDERKLSQKAYEKWDTMLCIIFFVIVSLYIIFLVRLGYLGLTKIL